MDFFEEFEHYLKLCMFLAFHWFRIFIEWCHKNFIQPIECTLNKKEPTENKWVQIYTLASCENEGCHRSYEKYSLPYTDNFYNFVENEFNYFLEKGHQEEIIENLFIVKNDNQCIVKSFPMYKPILWTQLTPRPSEISFTFVEYFHPKMFKPIELIIPTHFYTIGNDLFTKAFVLRQLELMNCSFIFDTNYEIRFLDHEINDRILKFDEYIVLYEKTYDTIKSVSKPT